MSRAKAKWPTHPTDSTYIHTGHAPEAYWAFVPKGFDVKFARIEKARTPEEAIEMATGYPASLASGGWRVKHLGSSYVPIQSDRQRVATLMSKKGWRDL